MENPSQSERMIGESAAFLLMQEQISRLAPLNKPVLIIGERGTGKELVAARLHYLSRRWEQTFLKINCAAFSESLLESQLFGHETGAFTGATKQLKGYFERAHGGTLFLDELASTTLAVQEKVLRVTEYGEIERLGGSRPLVVDVRIVAATNIDLPQLAAVGRFRQDLLDRLAFDVITLPPLRERREDIMVLARHFAIGMVKELGRDYFPGFSRGAVEALMNYAWPGNIRELKNVVERAVYQCEDPDSDIREIIFDPFDSPYRPRMPALEAQGTRHEVRQEDPPPYQFIKPSLQEGGFDFKQHVQEYEKNLLQQALQSCQFNQRKTAAHLDMTYDQLRGYLRKYGLT